MSTTNENYGTWSRPLKKTGLVGFLTTVDHKRIGVGYAIGALFFMLVGGVEALIIRLQLMSPENNLVDAVTYNQLFTMHGTTMVFLAVMPLSAAFFNFIMPLQIGARDMASGFINMLSYWFFFASSVVMISSLFVENGPASAGWTIYPPLSALPQAIPGSGTGMTLWLVSMSLFIVSSLLGALNYIVTVLNLRTKGMSMTRLPLTIWAFFVTAILGVLSFPVLFSAALLLIFDRSFGTSFYLSDIMVAGELLTNQGGSPILYQHLFWFLGHPEVYIILLPALGISSEVISTNARKPIFGYRAMVGSILAIAFLSFIVWGHHMFVTGMNPFLGSVFTFTTLLIAIPSAVKAFNYITTLWKGNLQFTPAMMFSIGLVSTFITGGVTGLILGDSALDINVHDTYFVVAHFHIVMGLSAIFGLFAGVYHWFPKLFGRRMNKNLGYVHFWVTFICAYGVFFPMHFLGMAGLPRRYYTNTNFPMFDDLADINVVVSYFAIIGGIAQVIFIYNFFYSALRGKKSSQNPWRSNTLEWTTPVEHVHGNWPGEIPEVHRWPYDYSKPGADEDFIPQIVPMTEEEIATSH